MHSNLGIACILNDSQKLLQARSADLHVLGMHNGPVFLATVPALVPRNLLDRAIALNSVQFNMARLAGPMIAAVLIGAVGVAGAFWEAIAAHSHRPAHPAEIDMLSERGAAEP
jgi:hypothetical protein